MGMPRAGFTAILGKPPTSAGIKCSATPVMPRIFFQQTALNTEKKQPNSAAFRARTLSFNQGLKRYQGGLISPPGKTQVGPINVKVSLC